MAPPVAGVPLAALREPSRLKPGPEGSWPLRFDRLVQPLLDQHCVRCHRPDSDDAAAAALDLTAAKSYASLMNFADRDLHKLAFERDRSLVGEMPARRSRLFQLLTAPEGHYQVSLSPQALRSLVTWMDTYAQIAGSYSTEQEEELIELRHEFADLFEP
jgi:hypothetical protein